METSSPSWCVTRGGGREQRAEVRATTMGERKGGDGRRGRAVVYKAGARKGRGRRSEGGDEEQEKGRFCAHGEHAAKRGRRLLDTRTRTRLRQLAGLYARHRPRVTCSRSWWQNSQNLIVCENARRQNARQNARKVPLRCDREHESAETAAEMGCRTRKSAGRRRSCSHSTIEIVGI